MNIRSTYHKDCPPAYGGCRCTCHSIPGVQHVRACCFPGRAVPRITVADEDNDDGDETPAVAAVLDLVGGLAATDTSAPETAVSDTSDFSGFSGGDSDGGGASSDF